jgi:hypothetical protein
MRYLVFSIILAASTNLFAKFDYKECINSSFKEEIKHKGKFFGLIKHKLKIQKDHCVIDLKFKKFTEKNWVIDICREPIHIKKKGSGIDVFKRRASCELDPKQAYCYEEKEVFSILQDDGLIFAQGERESISTQHGKIYCAFLLLQKYLKRGEVLSRTINRDLYDGIVDSAKNCDTKVSKEAVIERVSKPAVLVNPITTDPSSEVEQQQKEVTDETATPVGEF